MAAIADHGTAAAWARAQSRRRNRLRRLPLLPALLFTIVVTQIPFVLTIYYSLQSYNFNYPLLRHFAGLHNYTVIFSDAIFRTALVNTVVLTLVPVLASLLLGLGIAQQAATEDLAVEQQRDAEAEFGLLNWVLRPFGVHHTDWVNNHSKETIITVLTWQWTPFMVLILLAGLQSQPGDVLEAARVDGAGPWQIFRRMTLPHLRQYMELGIVLCAIYVVQAFDAI